MLYGCKRPVCQGCEWHVFCQSWVIMRGAYHVCHWPCFKLGSTLTCVIHACLQDCLVLKRQISHRLHTHVIGEIDKKTCRFYTWDTLKNRHLTYMFVHACNMYFTCMLVGQAILVRVSHWSVSINVSDIHAHLPYMENKSLKCYYTLNISLHRYPFGQYKCINQSCSFTRY